MANAFYPSSHRGTLGALTVGILHGGFLRGTCQVVLRERPVLGGDGWSEQERWPWGLRLREEVPGGEEAALLRFSSSGPAGLGGLAAGVGARGPERELVGGERSA